MDYMELIIAIISIACSAFLWFKNRSLSISVEEFKTELANKKILYTVCPKCGTKIYLTIENVKEEGENND